MEKTPISDLLRSVLSAACQLLGWSEIVPDHDGNVTWMASVDGSDLTCGIITFLDRHYIYYYVGISAIEETSAQLLALLTGNFLGAAVGGMSMAILPSQTMVVAGRCIYQEELTAQRLSHHLNEGVAVALAWHGRLATKARMPSE